MSPPRLTGALRSFSIVSRKEDPGEQRFDLKVRLASRTRAWRRLMTSSPPDSFWITQKTCCWELVEAVAALTLLSSVLLRETPFSCRSEPRCELRVCLSSCFR